MNNGKKRILIFSISGVLLIAGILTTVNILSSIFYARMDFSRGGIYSISKATKKVVRSLKDPLLIDVYYSKKFPSQITVMKGYLFDILKEYRQISKGKVILRKIEVQATTEDKQNAIRNGIVPVRFDIYTKEKFEQTEGFLGLVLKYRNKKKVIGFLTTLDGLEYSLTSKIKLLASPIKPKIAFIKNFGCVNYGILSRLLGETMSEKFDAKDLDITQTENISKDTKAVFLLGPQEKIPAKSLFILEQYLLKGGNLLVAYDSKKVNPRAFTASENDAGLDIFLTHHGIKPAPVLIFDKQSQPIQVTRNQGSYTFSNIVKYLPFIVSTDLNKKDLITKDINSLVFPFAAPLEFSKKTGVKFGVLAKSSENSWLVEQKGKLMSVSPFEKTQPSKTSKKGPFNLAVSVEGKFEPFYLKSPDDKITDFLKEAKKSAKLMVVATSKFISPQFRMPKTNFLFFLNLLDRMSQADDLISIRNKSAKFAPLREISLTKKRLIKYANILLAPLVAIIIGIILWQLKIMRLKKYKKTLFEIKK